MNDLKIVILRCPYINWSLAETKDFFTKMIALKLEGYQQRHFHGVMPIDQIDFIANHVLICEKINNNLIPISGAKSLPYYFCKPFRVEFTPISVFKKGNYLEHLQYTNNIIADCEKSTRQLTYYGAWTQSPDIKDNGLKSILKEIFAATLLLHHQEEKITDIIGFGLPKFKTDLFFYKLGGEKARLNNVELEHIPLEHLNEIESAFIHFTGFSPYIEEMVTKYKKLWNERITIGKSFQEVLFSNEENSLLT